MTGSALMTPHVASTENGRHWDLGASQLKTCRLRDSSVLPPSIPGNFTVFASHLFPTSQVWEASLKERDSGRDWGNKFACASCTGRQTNSIPYNLNSKLIIIKIFHLHINWVKSRYTLAVLLWLPHLICSAACLCCPRAALLTLLKSGKSQQERSNEPNCTIKNKTKKSLGRELRS